MKGLYTRSNMFGCLCPSMKSTTQPDQTLQMRDCKVSRYGCRVRFLTKKGISDQYHFNGKQRCFSSDVVQLFPTTDNRFIVYLTTDLVLVLLFAIQSRGFFSKKKRFLVKEFFLHSFSFLSISLHQRFILQTCGDKFVVTNGTESYIADHDLRIKEGKRRTKKGTINNVPFVVNYTSTPRIPESKVHPKRVKITKKSIKGPYDITLKTDHNNKFFVCDAQKEISFQGGTFYLKDNYLVVVYHNNGNTVIDFYDDPFSPKTFKKHDRLFFKKLFSTPNDGYAIGFKEPSEYILFARDKSLSSKWNIVKY